MPSFLMGMLARLSLRHVEHVQRLLAEEKAEQEMAAALRQGVRAGVIEAIMKISKENEGKVQQMEGNQQYKKQVKAMLDKGADVESAGYGGLRALHHTCNSSKEACVAMLLEHDANPNGADDAGAAPRGAAGRAVRVRDVTIGRGAARRRRDGGERGRGEDDQQIGRASCRERV